MKSNHFKANRITTALLLAAGIGNRLQPFTDSVPKCLLKINGRPILGRLMDNLCDNGFKRLVIVVGYLENRIRRFVNEYVGDDLTIEFITNPLFQTTNNIYSLWLARNKIRESFLLAESDLVFDASQLEGLLYPNKIAISRMQPWMNGTTITLDSLNRVSAFGMGSAESVGTRYKTVNLYSLSDSSWRKVVERLELYISSGKINEYYEVVFKEMIADGSLSMDGVFFDPERWYEIDTPADIVNAERILGKPTRLPGFV